jgi:hypothetical protein
MFPPPPLKETHAMYRTNDIVKIILICTDILSSKGNPLFNLIPILITVFITVDVLQFVT